MKTLFEVLIRPGTLRWYVAVEAFLYAKRIIGELNKLPPFHILLSQERNEGGSEIEALYLPARRGEKNMYRNAKAAQMPFHFLPSCSSFVAFEVFADWLMNVFGVQRRGRRDFYMRSWRTYHANRHVYHMFRVMAKYRSRGDMETFWRVAWGLMNSHSYQSMAYQYVRWNWYKELPLNKVRDEMKLVKRLCSEKATKIDFARVYIPKGIDKVRPLGVPTPAWRVYLHMLNNLVVWSRKGQEGSQHGYFPARGVSTAWRAVMDRLDSPNIYEYDFQGFFDSVDLSINRQLLRDKYLYPEEVCDFFLELNQSVVKLTEKDLQYEPDRYTILDARGEPAGNTKPPVSSTHTDMEAEYREAASKGDYARMLTAFHRWGHAHNANLERESYSLGTGLIDKDLQAPAEFQLGLGGTLKWWDPVLKEYVECPKGNETYSRGLKWLGVTYLPSFKDLNLVKFWNDERLASILASKRDLRTKDVVRVPSGVEIIREGNNSKGARRCFPNPITDYHVMQTVAGPMYLCHYLANIHIPGIIPDMKPSHSPTMNTPGTGAGHVLTAAKVVTAGSLPSHQIPLPSWENIPAAKRLKGVPQGAATSCSLSTVSLHSLLTENADVAVGYADDGLLFFPDQTSKRSHKLPEVKWERRLYEIISNTLDVNLRQDEEIELLRMIYHHRVETNTFRPSSMPVVRLDKPDYTTEQLGVYLDRLNEDRVLIRDMANVLLKQIVADGSLLWSKVPKSATQGAESSHDPMFNIVGWIEARSGGAKVNLAKSGWLKKNGVWLVDSFKFLGLRYYPAIKGGHLTVPWFVTSIVLHLILWSVALPSEASLRKKMNVLQHQTPEYWKYEYLTHFDGSGGFVEFYMQQNHLFIPYDWLYIWIPSVIILAVFFIHPLPRVERLEADTRNGATLAFGLREQFILWLDAQRWAWVHKLEEAKYAGSAEHLNDRVPLTVRAWMMEEMGNFFKNYNGVRSLFKSSLSGFFLSRLYLDTWNYSPSADFSLKWVRGSWCSVVRPRYRRDWWPWLLKGMVYPFADTETVERDMVAVEKPRSAIIIAKVRSWIMDNRQLCMEIRQLTDSRDFLALRSGNDKAAVHTHGPLERSVRKLRRLTSRWELSLRGLDRWLIRFLEIFLISVNVFNCSSFAAASLLEEYPWPAKVLSNGANLHIYDTQPRGVVYRSSFDLKLAQKLRRKEHAPVIPTKGLADLGNFIDSWAFKLGVSVAGRDAVLTMFARGVLFVSYITGPATLASIVLSAGLPKAFKVRRLTNESLRNWLFYTLLIRTGVYREVILIAKFWKTFIYFVSRVQYHWAIEFDIFKFRSSYEIESKARIKKGLKFFDYSYLFDLALVRKLLPPPRVKFSGRRLRVIPVAFWSGSYRMDHWSESFLGGILRDFAWYLLGGFWGFILAWRWEESYSLSSGVTRWIERLSQLSTFMGNEGTRELFIQGSTIGLVEEPTWRLPLETESLAPSGWTGVVTVLLIVGMLVAMWKVVDHVVKYDESVLGLQFPNCEPVENAASYFEVVESASHSLSSMAAQTATSAVALTGNTGALAIEANQPINAVLDYIPLTGRVPNTVIDSLATMNSLDSGYPLFSATRVGIEVSSVRTWEAFPYFRDAIRNVTSFLWRFREPPLHDGTDFGLYDHLGVAGDIVNWDYSAWVHIVPPVASWVELLRIGELAWRISSHLPWWGG